MSHDLEDFRERCDLLQGVADAWKARAEESAKLAEGWKERALTAEAVAPTLRANSARYVWLRAWLERNRLLHALWCQPERATPVNNYWVLRAPAVIDGSSCEGYAKTEDGAIDAAMEAKP